MARPPRRRLRRIVRILAVIIAIWLFANTVLAVQIHNRGTIDNPQPADTIIVLGAGLQRGGVAGPAMVRRVQHGAELWHQGYSEHIICTGGLGQRQPRTEAAACREILVDAGVAEDAIYMEETSTSTEENAIYSQKLMQQQGWQTALVVSDGYHILRSEWLFNKFDIEAVFSPVSFEDIPANDYIGNILRELMAWHWQIIKDGLGLPFTSFPP